MAEAASSRMSAVGEGAEALLLEEAEEEEEGGGAEARTSSAASSSIASRSSSSMVPVCGVCLCMFVWGVCGFGQGG